MDKGTRVEIVRGRKGVGQTGEIFWSGPDKFNEGALRFGVKGDDGQTYWVAADEVEKTDKVVTEPPAGQSSAPQNNVPAGDEIARGSRVTWSTGAGKVFWFGASRFGDGMRVGVEDEDGEKHWLDATEITVEAVEVTEAVARDDVPPPNDDIPPPSDDTAASSQAPWEWDQDDPGPGSYGPPVQDDVAYGNPDDIPF